MVDSGVRLLTVVAQAAGVGRALLWVGALMGVIIVAGLALMAVRRRLLARSAPAGGAVMELHELRALRERGDVTEEEFEALRGALLRGYGASPAGKGDGPAPAGERRAPLGFDLTGAPLPRAEDGGAGEGGSDLAPGGPPGSGT